jgi:hypothetical protein
MTGDGKYAGKGAEGGEKDRVGTSSVIVDGLALPAGGGARLSGGSKQIESFSDIATSADKAVDAYRAYDDGFGGKASSVNQKGASVAYPIGASPDYTPSGRDKFGTDTIHVPGTIYYSNDSMSRGVLPYERSLSPNPRGGIVTNNSTKGSIKPLFNLAKDKN